MLVIIGQYISELMKQLRRPLMRRGLRFHSISWMYISNSKKIPEFLTGIPGFLVIFKADVQKLVIWRAQILPVFVGSNSVQLSELHDEIAGTGKSCLAADFLH